MASRRIGQFRASEVGDMSRTYSAGKFDAIVDGSITEIESNVSGVGQYAFSGCTSLTSASFPKATSIEDYAFYGCTSLTDVNAQNLVSAGGSAFENCKGLTKIFMPCAWAANACFKTCSALKTVVIGRLNGGGSHFQGCTNITRFEMTGYSAGGAYMIANNSFNGAAALTTIVLGRNNTALASLYGVSSFTGTPFASGGSGGTIYIPKVLYDELGTGSSLDYKAAAGWATIDGYGTITWAPIEGSEYENYYADGTPVE